MSMRSGDPTSILLAARQPFLLKGLSIFFDSQIDVRVVAACSSGHEAVRKTQALSPNLCILDYALGDLGGPDIVRAVRSRAPRTRIIVLMGCSPQESVYLIRDAGADGVYTKFEEPEALLAKIARVMSGQQCFADHDNSDGAPKAALWPAGDELTPREAEIAAYVSAGLSSKEVARRLRLSEGTVKVHLGNIYRKIGVCNRTALAYALTRTGYDAAQAPSSFGVVSQIELRR